MRSWPMLKFSSERCVCAPQSLSAATSILPRLSNSSRVSAIGTLPDRGRPDCAAIRGGVQEHRAQKCMRFCALSDALLSLLAAVAQAGRDSVDRQLDAAQDLLILRIGG